MTPHAKHIAALLKASRNPKYRVKVLGKIKAIKEKKRINNWLAQ